MHYTVWKYLPAVATACFLVFASSLVHASPWTLPQDRLVLTMDYHIQHADYEFLADGTRQAYPLNGQFRGKAIRLGARYGFTDDFDGAISLDISQINYGADPLLLDVDFETAGEATQSILNFNSVQFGAGDLRLRGNYNLLRSSRGFWLVTSSTRAKLPTGYDAPTGTFFTDADGEERIGGQATRGDGQVDITQALMFGGFFAPTGGFGRAEVGLEYRFGDPGHRVVTDVRVGQPVGDRLIAIVGMVAGHNITEGEVIGQTMIANNPYLPASQFTMDNIRAEDLRLDSSNLGFMGGLLFDFGDIEFTTNYYYTAKGRNVAGTHAFTFGTIVSISDVTRSEDSDG